MKFIKEQRVTVPGTEAQAVIVDATETVPDFPIYTLRWLDEAGETHTGTCGEGDLAEANPSQQDIELAAADAKRGEDAVEHLVNLRVAAQIADYKHQQRVLDRKLARKKITKRKR